MGQCLRSSFLEALQKSGDFFLFEHFAANEAGTEGCAIWLFVILIAVLRFSSREIPHSTMILRGG